jgi:hypothetical protein
MCFDCHKFTLTPSIVKNYALILKCLKLGLLKQFHFFNQFELVFLSKKVFVDEKKRKPSKSTTKSDSENQEQ